jgi:hypothetical protein
MKVVLSIPELDISILDSDIVNTLSPIRIAGAIPNKGEKIKVYGFSFGSDNVGITKGTINRIIEISISGSISPQIVLQIDASIAPGNSGGPALNNAGELIGISVATAGYGLNCLIPVNYFIFASKLIDDTTHNKTYYFPSLCIKYQEIDSLINNLLKPKMSGIMITHQNKPLDKMDILTHINDVPIDFNGKIHISNIFDAPSTYGDFVSFEYYTKMLKIDDNVKLSIIRSGQEKTVSMKLTNNTRHKCQNTEFLKIGENVFIPCTPNVANIVKSKKGDNTLPMYRYNNKHNDEDVIILVDAMETEYSSYPFNSTKDITFLVVKSINDKGVRSFKDFIKIMTELIHKQKDIIVEFFSHNKLMFFTKIPKGITSYNIENE